jgi:hypothetical protein
MDHSADVQEALMPDGTSVVREKWFSRGLTFLISAIQKE